MRVRAETYLTTQEGQREGARVTALKYKPHLTHVLAVDKERDVSSAQCSVPVVCPCIRNVYPLVEFDSASFILLLFMCLEKNVGQ